MSSARQHIFKAPLNTWTADRILDYYCTRGHVHYFPRKLDPEKVTCERVNNILVNRFDFNGESYQLPESFTWTSNPSKSQDIEWLVAFHKFYYAVALGVYYEKSLERRYLDKWIDLTLSWIDTVPLGFLDSHVTGRRIENWIFAYYHFVSAVAVPELPPDFHLKFLESLFNQVCYLLEHLTPQGNHRTIELMAIFIAAVIFPEFRESCNWLDFSRRELLKNIQADLLFDGVHNELSIEYHHLVLRNYLRVKKLASLNDIALPEEMDELLQKALDFALYVHKPDGRIPALSDADMGSYLPLLEQGYHYYGHEEYLYGATQGVRGKAPSHRSRTFPVGGYTILRSGWGENTTQYTDEHYLIFDCGPFGQGQYGYYHGHIDVLNIELAAYGRSLIVDPGRYTYHETDPASGQKNWRAHFRGTRAHNTVQVDGREQLRYAFDETRYKILGPEPEHELHAFMSQDGFDFVHGVARSHEYDVVHERKIFFLLPEYWIVSDILLAGETHLYELRYHLSELAWQKTFHLRQEDADLIYAPHLVLAQPPITQVSTKIEDDFVAPSYGVKHSAPVACYAYEGSNMAFHTLLYPYWQERPTIAVQELPVFCAGRKCSADEAFALRIEIRAAGNESTDIHFCAQNDAGRLYNFAGFTCDSSLLHIRESDQGGFTLQPQTPVYLAAAGRATL